MSRTILTTPVINHICRAIALFMAWALGWKLPKKFSDIKKGIFIGAPHTSNWDFFVMLMAILIWRLDVNWVGKHSLFVGPLGPVMRWLGGISVDRCGKHNFVEEMVEHFRSKDHLLLVIAPEGTRAPVQHWRTGFYHIAQQANVPILLSYMDYKNKEAGIESIEFVTGNIEEDIKRYQDFYATKTGRNPCNYYGYNARD